MLCVRASASAAAPSLAISLPFSTSLRRPVLCFSPRAMLTAPASPSRLLSRLRVSRFVLEIKASASASVQGTLSKMPMHKGPGGKCMALRTCLRLREPPCCAPGSDCAVPCSPPSRVQVRRCPDPPVGCCPGPSAAALCFRTASPSSAPPRPECCMTSCLSVGTSAVGCEIPPGLAPEERGLWRATPLSQMHWRALRRPSGAPPLCRTEPVPGINVCIYRG